MMSSAVYAVDAVLEAVLEKVIANVKYQINQLRGGEELVRWIEYELESLVPQSERDRNDNLTNMIHKAEILAETYTKRVIQSKASSYTYPINSIRVAIITRKLHRIHDELSESAKQARIHHGFSLQLMDTTPHQLPSHLRRCIHYFILFPPDFQVPSRRLIALWVAEGLVRSNNLQSVEQIAERYLDELIHVGAIHVKRNRGGKVKTCSIDAGRRNALLKEAEEANFLQDRHSKIRRLVDHNLDGSSSSFIQINGDPNVSRLVPTYRDAISFLSFNTQEGSKPGEDIGDFLRKCISNGCFIWLRVLDLERVFRPKLPDALGILIALKYMGLRWTYLEKLPSSVDKLFNLQVLDVKHTYISVLPRSIWRMEYLRHLYLSEAYRTRFPDPPSKVTLTALQTLWGAFVDEDTPVVRGLDTLLNIRKLGLSCRTRESKKDEMSDKLKAIDKWISNLKHLESLRLKSRDDNGEPVDLHLTSLEGNKNLTTVYLLGKLDRSNTILCELPLSLTEITLSGSEFDLDPMGFLGRLPKLMILRLLGQSVVCSKMYCSARDFRQLKLLWIWKLEKLEDFEAEEGSLPCLEQLEIRSCQNMKTLPHQLRFVENLEIKLTSMQPEFVQKTVGEYVQIHHAPKDDQYILNTPTKGKKAQV